MVSIRDLPTAWRQDLLPASFRGVEFHVEANAKESGRRIVTHEFPKKDLPYAEDMGRRAIEFTVRGYSIVYPRDLDGEDLYRRDYRITRDRLIEALEAEGLAELQMPTLPPLRVVCTRYRVTEEDRLGGFAVFDMTFTEFGLPPSQQRESAAAKLQAKAEAMRAETERLLQDQLKDIGEEE